MARFVRRPILLYLPILAVGVALGQCTAPKPTFEVASVRSLPPDSPEFATRGGPGTNDPERITYRGISMHSLLMTAYGLHVPEELSGPAWLDKEKYQISAKVPKGATKEQLSLMLQSLLEEEFQMKVRHETRELPIYELSVAKPGVIEKAALVAPCETPCRLELPPGAMHILLGRACAPTTEPTFCGHARIFARQQSSADVAEIVREMLGRLTIDKTGLTGKYDFMLDFAPDSVNLPSIEPAGVAPALNSESFPAFLVALQRQLGLKIESKKGRVPVVVIEQLEKTPIRN